jgi:hypothetical protein
MDKIWKIKFEFQDQPHPVKVFLTRGNERWWVNTCGYYHAFYTYQEAETYFDRMVRSVQRCYHASGTSPIFEEFVARVGRSCRRLAKGH